MRIADQVIARFGFTHELYLDVNATPGEVLARVEGFLSSGGNDSHLGRSFHGTVVGRAFRLSRRRFFEESTVEGQLSATNGRVSVQLRAACTADVARTFLLMPLFMLAGTTLQQLWHSGSAFVLSYVLTATAGGTLVALAGLFLGGLRARSFNRDNILVVQRVILQSGAA